MGGLKCSVSGELGSLIEAHLRVQHGGGAPPLAGGPTLQLSKRRAENAGELREWTGQLRLKRAYWLGAKRGQR
jgi:hypothetical protein